MVLAERRVRVTGTVWRHEQHTARPVSVVRGPTLVAKLLTPRYTAPLTHTTRTGTVPSFALTGSAKGFFFLYVDNVS